jgi:small conductance mechanosensitive channel
MSQAPAYLAIALALLLAYLVADVVGRAVESVLRAIIPDERERAFIDRPRTVIRLVIFAVSAAAISLPALRFAGYPISVGGSPEALARWALDAGIRIVLIGVAAYFVIRVGSASARRFEREMSSGTGLDVIERTKRARTLSELLQKTLYVMVIGVAGLMILRELSIDITPVLTGAGIVGLAVGFGAQTLVRDVISGFFLILEDQVRVGDVAVVNGQGGGVEAVNLRTIVLRDENGTVHVFPNGEVKTLANLSKDFSYFVISLPVAFDEDPERVVGAMLDAGASLQQDDQFKPHILAPREVYGVDALDAGQFVVKGRIKTVPLKQWTVGRELRRRLTALLKERNIQLPQPTMRVYMQTPVEVTGRAVASVDDEAEAAADEGSPPAALR